MKTISVVVPCLNEQEAIPLFYSAFLKETAGMDVAFEFKRLRAEDPRVKYISFSRNFGKESAMYAGMEASTGDYVVIMDVDLQDPPALLPDMLRGIREEAYDCVATRRVTRAGEPMVRSFFARMFPAWRARRNGPSGNCFCIPSTASSAFPPSRWPSPRWWACCSV